MSSQKLSAPDPSGHPQWQVLAPGLAILVLLGVAVGSVSWRQLALLLLGSAFGGVLVRARFGFSSGFRQFLSGENSQPVLAQLWLLALTSGGFALIFSLAETWGWSLEAAIAPVGLAGVTGAFLFGIGMQLSRACGCGTLAATGTGSITLLTALIGFAGGGFLASLLRPLWGQWPSQSPWVFAERLGWGSALLFQYWLLLLLGVLLWRFAPRSAAPAKRLWMGATAIGLLYLLMLLVAGEPWRLTWGLVLSAARLARGLGWDPQSSLFWSNRLERLEGNLLAEPSVVTDLGLVIGALLVTAWQGGWRWKGFPQPRTIAIAGTGGITMGFGAFMASGCNISAYLAGIASTSLHGWLWLIAALAGSWLGIRLRERWSQDEAAS